MGTGHNKGRGKPRAPSDDEDRGRGRWVVPGFVAEMCDVCGSSRPANNRSLGIAKDSRGVSSCKKQTKIYKIKSIITMEASQEICRLEGPRAPRLHGSAAVVAVWVNQEAQGPVPGPKQAVRRTFVHHFEG